MSIEQHHGHPMAHETAPADAGAAFAHLLDRLTRVVLGLPDADPVVLTTEEPHDEPAPTDSFSDRRPTNVLGELGFLDD